MSIFDRKQKKDDWSGWDTAKSIGAVTSAILALNKVVKEKVDNQRVVINRKKEVKRRKQGALLAGFVGGIVAGAITALLLAPESGEELRGRVTGLFDSENGHDEDAILAEARQKAEALAERAKAQAADAEKGMQDN